MNTGFDLGELRTLFAALHDGTISTEHHARLERILTENPDARRLWFLHCDLETCLAEWASARSERNANIIAIPPFTFRRTLLRFAPLAAAAALVLMLFRWWPRPYDPAPAEVPASGVAVLARAVGVEWNGRPPTAGAVLSPGVLRLNSGAALVEFYSGARVVLEGPAEFRLIAAGEAFLSAGKIHAHVPPQARGFTVGSPGIKVVDHGTDFGFEVKPGAASEVHVFEGNVEVASATLPPLALNKGEAARFAGATPARIPATPSAFLSEDELAARDSAQAQARIATWREASHPLDAIVHYTFEESDALEHRVANRSPAPAAESNGSIVGGAWTEGRWPGKRALEFRGEGDRVRFIDAQPMNAITLLAWVRVSSLPRAQNVLLATDSEQPGALHWHLTQAGALRLEIARDLGRPNVDWEAVNSAPFVTPDRFGQWLLLATTFDGTTIRHYGNGQLVGRGASFTPPALVVGAAELANWRGSTQRQLAATIDEFAIVPRAMSAREILNFYAAGKP